MLPVAETEADIRANHQNYGSRRSSLDFDFSA
jgi:hypothetical protein